MDTLEKMNMLGRSAQYDICTPSASPDKSSPLKTKDSLGHWIYPAALPGGKHVRLFKVLLTNACGKDCAYCANRCSRDFSRCTFQPEELAGLFMTLHAGRRVQGLFLSSAIPESSSRTLDDMLKTAEILRRTHRFSGYIHLKILPGARFDQVERAIELSDRVSINLEAPNPERLKKISADKDFQDLLLRMRWIKDLRAGGASLPAGHTTQFVVGPSEEPDKEILETTARLYRSVGLSRAYFSAFQPVRGTPLEDCTPVSSLREHRLYQADFLLRRYGFRFEELVFDPAGALPTKADPKLAWALAHPEGFPLEVNRASYEELLRIPGIGPKSASRIVRVRGKGLFHTIEELKGTGIAANRAAPFLLIGGRKEEAPKMPVQLELWDIAHE